MKRVFLSARFGRRLEVLALAQRLLAQPGYEVTAGWVDASYEPLAFGARSLRNYRDCLKANCSIHYTEPPDAPAEHKRGNRHVEYGYALSGGHAHVILVGPYEIESHYLPGVHRVDTAEAALALLATLIDPEEGRAPPPPAPTGFFVPVRQMMPWQGNIDVHTWHHETPNIPGVEAVSLRLWLLPSYRRLHEGAGKPGLAVDLRFTPDLTDVLR
jgi:hypothetical protein